MPRIIWTSDAKAAQREIERIARANERLQAQIAQLTGDSKQAADVEARTGRVRIETAEQGVTAVRELEQQQGRLMQRLRQAQGQAKEKEAQTRQQTLEERKLADAARRVYDETRTPMERYAAKMRELNQLRKQGLVNEETYARAAGQTTREMHKQTGLATTGLGQWMSGLTGVVTGYLSVQGAISLVTQAMQEQDELRRKIQEETTGVAAAERGSVAMLPVKSEEELRRFQSAVDRIVARTKPAGGREAVHQIMAETLSAAGDVDLAARATELGLEIQPYDAESAKAIAAGAIDFADLLGQSGDLKQNLGWLISVLGQARLVSIPGLAKYGAPAIGTAAGTGLSVEESAALYNAMTKALKDSEGRRAGTATVTAAQMLEQLLPEKDVWRVDYDAKTGLYTRRLERAGTGLKTLEEKLARIREDEDLRLEFEQKIATAEKKAQGGLKAMIGVHPMESLNRAWRQSYDATMEAMPAMGAEARAEAERTIELLNKSRAQRIGESARAVSMTFEQLGQGTEFGRRTAAEAAYVWGGEEGLSKLLMRSGAGQEERWQAWIEYHRRRAGGTPREAYEAVLQRRIRKLRGEYHEFGEAGFGAPPPGSEGASQDELLRATILEEHLAELREATGALTEAGRKLDAAGDRLGRPGGNAPPAVLNQLGPGRD